MIADVPAINLLGVDLALLDAAGAAAEIESFGEGRGPFLVVYANAHTLNLAARNPKYRDLLNRATLVLNDGTGVTLAARLRGGRFPANLNGTDFNPVVLDIAARLGWKLFLLGARPGVAAAASERLRAGLPQLRVVGVHHGYFRPDREAEVVASIRASGADAVLAAFGNPRQEEWLDRNLPATGARIGIGVGAFFDFTAGEVPRAPTWLRRLGIEWVYRLALEPRRMWRRYVLGNPIFLARALLEQIGVIDYR